MAGTASAGLRALRVLTAVVALYALVLQAFLGGLAAMPAAASVALPFAELCLDGAGGADPATPHGPGQQHACCWPATHPVAGPPPLPAVSAIAWPPRRVARLAWHREGVASARAPPGSIASARGPPAA